jgi:hypothetical protein
MMTRQKSFKSRVRARMDSTGESYTTARRQLMKMAEPDAPVDSAATSTAPGPEAIRAQKFSDASVRERTGRGWDEWFALLDAWGADERTHAEIASWLVTAHRVPGWWAQTVTVGYEQARGMRMPGQTSSGDFAANASKTVAVSAERLFTAFADDTIRRRWLPDGDIHIRTATAPKSLRADWSDGATRIAVGVTSKGAAKAQVAVQHEKLADSDQAARMKAYWRERLATLKQLLES